MIQIRTSISPETTIEFLDSAYTREQLRARMDTDHMVTATVAINFYDIVDLDEEAFHEMLSQAVTDTDDLIIITYRIVGHQGNILFIEVTGGVCDIICGEDTEGDDE